MLYQYDGGGGKIAQMVGRVLYAIMIVGKIIGTAPAAEQEWMVSRMSDYIDRQAAIDALENTKEVAK